MSQTNPNRLSRNLILLVLIGLVLYALAFQGMRGLWDSSEGRYTNVALEMLRFDDWLHPQTHHEHPHWTKPPMTYWALAGALKYIGHSEWSARLPGALAFILTTLLIWRLGAIFVPARPWLPAVMYASFVMPGIASNVITTDNLLTLAETATMTAFALAIWSPVQSLAHRYAALLGWIAAGLGFLIKGPAVGLPIVALMMFHFLHRRQLTGTRIWWLSGSLLAGAIGASWFIALAGYNPTLLFDFVWNEAFVRATSGQHHRNSGWYGGLVIYLPVLLIGTLPWTWSVVRGVATPLRRWWQTRTDTLDRDALQERFLLLWLLFPLLVFLVARSRLPLYVLPLFVPLALLGARTVGRFIERRYWYLLPITAMAAVLGLRIGAALVDDDRDSRALARQILQLHSAPVAEIIFLEMDAQQGLTLYIDTEVEALTLGTSIDADGRQTADNELTEDESDQRLWLPTAKDAVAFEAWARRAGREPVFLGEVSGLYSYRLYRLANPGN